jgi:hypothetical protein
MSEEVNSDFIRRIQKHEIQEALRMRSKKAVERDSIPIEV